jgi:four helix bundle protein
MAFDALDASLALIPLLRGPAERIAAANRDLAAQIRRSASSVALNLAEGRRRAGGDRLHSWRVAAGSNDECRVALQVAIGWGWIGDAEIAEALELHDRLAAMLHRLTRR